MMKGERKICIWVAFLAIVMAITMVYFFSKNAPPEPCSKLSLLFLGIGLLLIVFALLAIAILMLWQWGKIIANQMEEGKKQVERLNSEECMRDLKEDAKKRQDIERERNRINDLFRLIELAKAKSEEITDKTKTKEKGDAPKTSENNIITAKKELVSSEKLDKLIVHYQALSSNQQIQTK